MCSSLERNTRSFFSQVLTVPLFALVISVGAFSAPAVAQDVDAFMQASGEWLEARQRPDGSFPLSEGDPPALFFASVQSPAALGVLGAWVATEDPDFLASAVAAGDYLINNFDSFPTAAPRIRAFDPLFFVRLSDATGDPQYADFIQVNFWDPLAAGTYGPTGDWDIDDYVASELARRGAQPSGEVIAAWDLALVAAAAREAGIVAFDGAFAAGAATALESTPDTIYTLGTEGFDILGLAGAVWIAGITEQSVTPASGAWAGLSNVQLAQRLVAHQSSQGGFLQSTQAFTSPVDPVSTVSQVTSFAILALQAMGEETYFFQIQAGLNALIDIFQEPSGRINFYHPLVDLSAVADPKPYIYLSGYALFAVQDGRDPETPFRKVPTMAPWGLALLMLLLISLGGLALTVRR
jgi:hypothetical protein